MLAHFFLAASTFVITNIDDLLILTFYFASNRYTTRAIVSGQYLGIIFLILVSLGGLLFNALIPGKWIALLGILPILLGLKALRDAKSDSSDNAGSAEGSPSLWHVAAVTIANGGDNIAVYTPLFAKTPLSFLPFYTGIFLILTGFWCFLGHFFLTHRTLKEKIHHYGKKVFPYFLIALGGFILKDFFQ